VNAVSIKIWAVPESARLNPGNTLQRRPRFLVGPAPTLTVMLGLERCRARELQSASVIRRRHPCQSEGRKPSSLLHLGGRYRIRTPDILRVKLALSPLANRPLRSLTTDAFSSIAVVLNHLILANLPLTDHGGLRGAKYDVHRN
jgi:hypothetical protein